VLGHQRGGGLGQRQEASFLVTKSVSQLTSTSAPASPLAGRGHHAFGGDAPSGLAGLGAELDAQQFLRLGHVAFGFGQRAFAFHHGGVGLAAQFSHHACRNCSHFFSPYVMLKIQGGG
jgi:hypothetical protein